MANSLIRDRIIVGINNRNTRKKLLAEKNLELKKCIDICRSVEITDKRADVFGTTEAVVHGLRGSRYKSTRPKSGKGKPQSKEGMSSKTSRPKHEHDKKHSGRCKYCGDSHKKGQCPAYGHRCTYCSKEHHFESVCLTKARNAARPNNIRGVDYDDS